MTAIRTANCISDFFSFADGMHKDSGRQMLSIKKWSETQPEDTRPGAANLDIAAKTYYKR